MVGVRLYLKVKIDGTDTPWKINMEPTNHPFRKENDLNQTSMILFHVIIFRGVEKMGNL